MHGFLLQHARQTRARSRASIRGVSDHSRTGTACAPEAFSGRGLVASRPPAEEIGLRPGGRAAGRVLDRDELEKLAGVQLGQLVEAALHDQGGGVEGLGGAVVVLGGGGVEGGASEQDLTPGHLPPLPSPPAGRERRETRSRNGWPYAGQLSARRRSGGGPVIAELRSRWGASRPGCLSWRRETGRLAAGWHWATQWPASIERAGRAAARGV